MISTKRQWVQVPVWVVWLQPYNVFNHFGAPGCTSPTYLVLDLSGLNMGTLISGKESRPSFHTPALPLLKVPASPARLCDKPQASFHSSQQECETQFSAGKNSGGTPDILEQAKPGCPSVLKVLDRVGQSLAGGRVLLRASGHHCPAGCQQQ